MRVNVCALQVRASLRTYDVARLAPEEAQLIVLPPHIAVDGATLARNLRCYVAMRDKLAVLYDPAGDILIEQPETFGHTLRESAMTVDTEIGCIGLLCGKDVMRPEVSRALAMKGATLLLHSSQRVGPFVEVEWLSGLWRECQNNTVFGVEAARVGDGYEGRSAICVPIDMTERRDGLLSVTDTTAEACVVMAELDFHERLSVVESNPMRFNSALYRKMLEGMECDWP
jgi:predicted amidohydrolase